MAAGERSAIIGGRALIYTPRRPGGTECVWRLHTVSATADDVRFQNFANKVVSLLPTTTAAAVHIIIYRVRMCTYRCSRP